MLSEIIAKDYYPGSTLDLTRLHKDVSPIKVEEQTQQTIKGVNWDD